jgi:hypothetical protein
MLGEIMKSTILHKFLFAIVCTILLGGMSATGLYAASTAQNDTVLLDALHAGNDVACTDCHGDNTQREAVSMLTCLECHDTAALAETTADVKPTNPHKNRHYSTEADCNLCHHQHKKSENFCLPCHVRFDFSVP